MTRTPPVVCTPIACPNGRLVCKRQDNCPGGCGTICDQAVTKLQMKCEILVKIKDTYAGFPTGRVCTAELTLTGSSITASSGEYSQIISCSVIGGSNSCYGTVYAPFANVTIKEARVMPSNLSDEESLQLGIISRKDSPVVTVDSRGQSVSVSYYYLAP